jgi:hypothetical protein
MKKVTSQGLIAMDGQAGQPQASRIPGWNQSPHATPRNEALANLEILALSPRSSSPAVTSMLWVLGDATPRPYPHDITFNSHNRSTLLRLGKSQGDALAGFPPSLPNTAGSGAAP